MIDLDKPNVQIQVRIALQNLELAMSMLEQLAPPVTPIRMDKRPAEAIAELTTIDWQNLPAFDASKAKVNIYWSEDDASFLAEAPDLPGCIANGATRAEAITAIEAAMRTWEAESLERVMEAKE